MPIQSKTATLLSATFAISLFGISDAILARAGATEPRMAQADLGQIMKCKNNPDSPDCK